MGTTIDTDVIIIGAGPTGLHLACQFVRYGVDFVLVEKRGSVTEFSKALGVQSRTLEIYEQMGLSQMAVEQGTVAEKWRLMFGGRIRGEIDLLQMGKARTPYPFMLLLEQSKNEALLYDYLRSSNKEVLWNAELERFSQNSDGVTAQVKFAHGASQTINAKYLVGCDGPRSLVRNRLEIEFSGNTFERIFYVADVQLDWRMSHEALHISFAKNSFIAFFPLRGERHYRIVGVLPEGFDGHEDDVLYEEVEARIKQESKIDLDITHVEWFSTYKVHTRHAARFSKGRCLLAGDAAHIHTPAGAQGMNTGIQDGYNLAWKIALVLSGKGNEKLLETYNEERLENAKQLLKRTDRLFKYGTSTNWLIDLIRTNILPPIASRILSLEVVGKFVFSFLSQIGISYSQSSLSSHDGDDNFRIKAGDRMPYFEIEGRSVFDNLRQPKFHWLLFVTEENRGRELEEALENEFSELIDFNIVPLDPNIATIFGTGRSFSVLLRPDNYIGFVTTRTSLDEVRKYIDKFIS